MRTERTRDGMQASTWWKSAIVASFLILASCGSSSVADSDVAAHLRSRFEGAARPGPPAENFLELLPNVSYIDVETGAAEHQSDLLLTGDVVGVETGRLFLSQDDDESVPGTFEVDTVDEANWATLHLTVQVNRVSSKDEHAAPSAEGAPPPRPETMIVGLVISNLSSIETYKEELRSLETIVVPTYGGSPIFSYDPEVLAIAYGGAFLGVVADDGTVSFPFASAETVELYAMDGLTIQAIHTYTQSPRSVEIVHRGPIVYRADDTASMARDGVDPVLRASGN